MKKVILLSLVLALMVAMVVPQSAMAWSWSTPKVGVDTTVLNFTAIEGVNPSNQSIGVYNAGGRTLYWTVTDNAWWLSVWPSVGSSRGETDNVKVTINSKNLPAGEYHATITVKKTFSSDKKYVSVNLTVVEPERLGPIMIGMEGIFPWSPEDEFKGLSLSLLTKDGLLDLSGAAVEIGSTFDMDIDRGEFDGYRTPITGSISGGEGIPSGQILQGSTLMPLGALLGLIIYPPPDINSSHAMLLSIDTSGDGLMDESYMGMLIGDVGELLDLLPILMGMLGMPDEEAIVELTGPNGQLMGLGINGAVIPLDPILQILPCLLPIVSDILSNPDIIAIIKDISGIIPPVVVIMPQSLMLELVLLLAG